MYGPFTKHPERTPKLQKKSRVDLNYKYKNELDKASFAHDAAYSDRKDLDKETISDKVLKYKVNKIVVKSKCDGYQRELAYD